MPDTLDNQINYKLGKIEASVDSLTHFMKNQFANLDQKLDESNRRTDSEITALNLRYDNLETKMNNLQGRMDGLHVKGGFLVSAVSLFWILFGDLLKNLF